MASSQKNLPYSSTKNVLLMKSDIGKAKPTIYSLPKENFTYGKPYIKDKEGAKEGFLKSNSFFITKYKNQISEHDLEISRIHERSSAYCRF